MLTLVVKKKNMVAASHNHYEPGWCHWSLILHCLKFISEMKDGFNQQNNSKVYN